jgi:hypothetical protein
MNNTKTNNRITTCFAVAIWFAMSAMLFSATVSCSDCEQKSTHCVEFNLNERKECPSKEEASPSFLSGLGSRAKLISLDSEAMPQIYQIGDGGTSSIQVLKCCYKFTYELCG